jgi:hypothetical protein
VTFQFPPRREDEGDLGPPPPPFRIGGRGRGGRQRFELRSFGNYNRWIILGVVIILAYIVLNTLKSIYVDWLWFDGIGYRSVYSKVIGTQTWLFLAAPACSCSTSLAIRTTPRDRCCVRRGRAWMTRRPPG